jgi:hypothetical protein
MTRARRVWDAAFVVALVAVLLSHVAWVVAGIWFSPVSFDEGFNLLVPVHLANGLGYTVDNWVSGGDLVPFPTVVSTGAPVLAPIGAVFAVTGPELVAARAVGTAFFVAFLAGAAVLAHRIGGRWAVVAALAAVSAVRLTVDYPATVVFSPVDALGEYPATAMLLWAIVVLERRPWLAGILAGLAVLTKTVAAIAVPFLVLGVVLAIAGPGWRTHVRRALVALGGAAAGFAGVVAAWEVVKLVSLGPAGYLQWTREFLGFFRGAGSGSLSLDRQPVVRLDLLTHAFYGPRPIVVPVAAVACALAGTALVLLVRRWSDPAARALVLLGVSAVGTFGGFALWWLLVSDRMWVRHLLIGLLIGLVAIAAFAVVGTRELWHRLAGRLPLRRVLGAFAVAGAVGLFSWQTVEHAPDAFDPPGWTRAEQFADAAAVSATGITGMQHVGWWQNPELVFLTGIPSAPLDAPGSTGPLVLEPIMRFLDGGTYDRYEIVCPEVLYEREGEILVCDLGDVRPQPVG